mgnify:FL=1|jgi:hypothetical protein
MNLIFTKADQDKHLEIAAKLTRSTGWRDDATSFAAYDERGDEQDLLAVVVFQNVDMTGADIHFAGARPGWASRRLLRGLFRFAFAPRLAGYNMLRAPIPEANVDAMVLALRSGFRFDGRLRAGAADGSDAILMSMKRDECRWILPVSNITPMREFARAAE